MNVVALSPEESTSDKSSYANPSSTALLGDGAVSWGHEMMEVAWREPAETGVLPDWMEPWMEPFARTTHATRKYVVSSTLDRVDRNAELVRGDLEKAVQRLKRESGEGLLLGGMKLPLALAEQGSRRVG